jgi:aspyridone synthetase trans-acting enoyl reductase
MREALISSTAGKLELARNVEIPLLEPGMMLCRVAAVGLNPADVKSSDHTTSPDSIGGFDFAGEVLRIGEDVTRFKPGDRVAGFAHGYNADNKESGAFTSLLLAMEDMTLKIPTGWTYEQGATLGVVVSTTGYALNHYLDVPLPERGMKEYGSQNEYILVSGGATATGIVAIQLLCLAGFKPVATCSPRSMDMVRSLGAVATFDYNLPSCGIDIRSFTGDMLTRALDCVTTSETMSMCYEAISSKGGRYISLDPNSAHVKYTRRDVSADWVMAMSLTGNRVNLPGVYGRPAIPTLRGLASRVFCRAEELISRGELRVPPFQVRSGGLAAVQEGIQDLRKGLANGKKWVYPLA